MIDFEITQENLSKAARQMTKARTSAANELVDLTCYRDDIKFVVTGREFTCPARVELKGMAQFPLDLLPRLRKVAATFGDKPARIRIEDGRIRVNSMSITVEAITTRKMSDRPIDIPDDAPVSDVLALHYLFTAAEIADSDLTARVLAADSDRLKCIQSAASTLAHFCVPAVLVETLVNDALKAHAEALRPILLPAMISGRPN
jgi:hypothetical protein